ncbi:ROK family protein [Pseudoroseicyclus tamaricis]|uniref:ROK family protein n=1 Tax=Pseudoroseicyclus tamaricis TaxID=2705421 RepID=A0A6B2JIR6_9RHOB|nr:ROK family protein [Pseudoroseicyclus tamaricis]NDV01291.1 ROK family protein [Pseudoroseicyclus tamaricis]
MEELIIARGPGAASEPSGCGPLVNAPVAGDSKPLRQLVFEHVRASGRAARADVVRALGISAGSVTTLTSDLIGQGYLREVADAPRERLEPGRGRPPVALEVVGEAHNVIGIKLGDERHTAVLADFAGTIRAEAAVPASPGRKSLPDMLGETGRLVDRLLQEAKLRLDDIAAVGLGLPGMIDHNAGTVAWSPVLTRREERLAEAFEERFGVPAHIDNDANMLTLAELWFGAGRNTSDFIVVTIEGGVGMGAVIGGKLWRGTRGMGLELGHTKVQIDGALCRCGKRGCLEAYIADYALAREARTALGMSTRDPVDVHRLLADLFAEAKAGSVSARSIFERAGRILALGLSNIIQIFDPELLILSGERMQYDYLYADEVFASLHRLVLDSGRPQADVQIHAWGDLVWARGATALALDKVSDCALGSAASA